MRTEKQVHHLRLHADVERAHRLVADHQLRLAGKGAGDGDALALAAAELVRPAARLLGPQADALQQLRHARRFAPAMQPVQAQRLAQRGLHGHARVEAAIGVLEHQLHALAPGAQPPRRQRQQVLAGERRGGPNRAPRGAAAGGPAWTCRSRSRPRWRASRRAPP
jgi:hypothetical protein